MITPSHPSPIFPSAAGSATRPSALPGAHALEQKAQAKAQKKRRKLERLLFFLGWCEGCRSYGNSV